MLSSFLSECRIIAVNGSTIELGFPSKICMNKVLAAKPKWLPWLEQQFGRNFTINGKTGLEQATVYSTIDEAIAESETVADAEWKTNKQRHRKEPPPPDISIISYEDAILDKEKTPAEKIKEKEPVAKMITDIFGGRIKSDETD